MPDRTFPMLTAKGRRAYAAGLDAVAGALLDSEGLAKFEPSVQRVEFIERGRRERVHIRGLDAPIEFDIRKQVGTDGEIAISMSAAMPVGLTTFRYDVRDARGTTVVEASMAVFAEVQGLDLDRYAAQMRQGLEQVLERVGLLLGEATPPNRTLDPRRFKMDFKSPATATKGAARSGSKYGGQPAWIDTPRWPVSRSSGKQMTFVMQIELPKPFRNGGHTMAYVFIGCDPGDDAAHPCEADGGENAVILQGGKHFHPHTITATIATGPSLVLGERSPGSSMSMYDPRSPSVEGPIVVSPAKPGDEFPEFSMIGGDVEWLQNDDTPADGPWVLLAQVECEHFPCWVPFDGWAYVFLSADGTRARFLHQST